MLQRRKHVAGWGQVRPVCTGQMDGALRVEETRQTAGRREGRRAAWWHPAGAESVPPPAQEEPVSPQTLLLSPRSLLLRLHAALRP